MYSRDHAIISGILGIILTIPAPREASILPLWILVVGLGVGIDIDHFLIARVNLGDWSNLTRCLRHPSMVFLEQESIFAEGDIWRDQRLLSHLVIGGILLGGMWQFDRFLASAAGLTIYVHVLSDLVHDIRTREEYLSRGP